MCTLFLVGFVVSDLQIFYIFYDVLCSTISVILFRIYDTMHAWTQVNFKRRHSYTL
jgi:hypothetical protein